MLELVRYGEPAADEIRRALRFTMPQTHKAYVWPARHYASDLTEAQYPPIGQRFRLQASFDISGFCPKVSLSGGQHDIKVEYYERGGRAVAKFWWGRAA